jgi:hypothetical protein
MTHLSYEILLNYLEDQLPVEERNAVDAHLAEPCPQCDQRLALLRSVFESTAGDQTVAPSEVVLKQAVGIAQRQPSRSKPWMRVVAALSFDSRLQLSPASMRGAGRARQMLFTTEQVDIDLQVKPAGVDHDLLGQVLGAGHSGETVFAFVSLQSSTGQPLKATETDLLGQFAFRQIPSGTYDLIFDLETQEVAVTGLEFQND